MHPLIAITYHSPLNCDATVVQRESFSQKCKFHAQSKSAELDIPL